MNNHGAGFILDQFTIHRYHIHCLHQFAIHCVLKYTVTYWSKIPDTIHCVHQCNHPVYHSHFSERGYQGMLPIALIQRPEINWALGFDEGGVGHYFEQTGGDSAVPVFSSCLSTLSPRRCSHHFLKHDNILGVHTAEMVLAATGVELSTHSAGGLTLGARRACRAVHGRGAGAWHRHRRERNRRCSATAAAAVIISSRVLLGGGGELSMMP
eukprot:COSAG01_NODE_10_length_42970_cov_93.010007_15_plen_211_part_00